MDTMTHIKWIHNALILLITLVIVINRSAYINLILNALNTIQQQQQQQQLQLQVYETCNLNVKTLLDEYNIDNNLWIKNETKLKELFIFSDV